MPLALAAALAAGPAPASAQTLDVVTGPDYAPFTGPDLPSGGLATDLLRAAVQTQGYELDVTFMPWKRAFQQTVAAETDGAFPYIQTEARRDKVRFSEPMVDFEGQVISAAESPVRFDGNPDQLAGKRICLPQGYGPEPLIAELLDAGRLEPVEPYGAEKCLALIRNDRADFQVMNNFVWPTRLEAEGLAREDVHVAEAPVSQNTLHFIVGRQHPDGAAIIDAVSAGLAELRANGQYDTLVANHLPGQS